MWVLSKKDAAPGKINYVVGRSGVDIVLRDDASISRSHAKLTINSNKLSLEDIGSKYGTYLNAGIVSNVGLKKNEKVEIKENDTIRFGLMQNIWSVGKLKFASLISSLSKEENLEMVQIFRELGVQWLNAWSNDCTHLTMNNITITIKLLYALIEELPIVTTKYWQDVFKAVRDNENKLPPVEKYIPTVNEMAVDISARPERKSVFNGITFVFMNANQLNMYGPIIKKAGGICKDLNTGVQKALLIKKNVAVVQYLPTTQSQSSQMTISWIADFLTKNSKRMIPEYEIGLAIVHCSTEKYCNASHKMVECLLPVEEKHTTPAFTVLIENSAQSCSEKSSNSTEVVVPETDKSVAESMQVNVDNMIESEEPEEIGRGQKRKHSTIQSVISDDSEDDQAEPKKANIEITEKRLTRSSPLNQPNVNKTNIQMNDDEDENDLIQTQPFVPEQQQQNEPIEKVKTCIPKEITRPKIPINRATRASTRKDLTKSAVAVDESDEDDTPLFDFVKKQGDSNSNNCRTRSRAVHAGANPNESNPSNAEDSAVLPMFSIESNSTKCTSQSKSTELVANSKSNSVAEFEDDDHLFDFVESPKSQTVESPKCSNLPSNSKTLSKSPAKSKPSPKPLPITTKSRSTRTVAGFLEKSQPQVAHNCNTEKITNEENDPTRKRRRIPVIGDDDDDENLFDFIGEEKSKKLRLNDSKPRCSYNDSNDGDDLFAFKENTTSNREDDVDDVDDMAATVPQQLKTTKSETLQMPKPKILPKTVNISDWIVCNGVKVEQAVKEQSQVKQEDDEAAIARQQWIDSLKGGFEVQFCNLNISTHSNETKNKCNDSIGSSNNTTNPKNFKAFVKKRNLHPQQRIIKLCQQPLPGRA